MDRTITVPVLGADLHAVAHADIPRAVFVHGLGDDLRTWDGLLPLFDPPLAALRYDLRGSGRSLAREAIPFKHASDLLAVLDVGAIDRCDLIGVSLGGSVALNFALNYPERVRNLVLISPHIVAWEWSDAWLQLWQPIVAAARAGKLEAAKRLWWEHPLFATTRASAAREELYESIMRSSGEQWLGDHHELMLPDVERLHGLAVRTLLLTGERDLDDFRLMADLLTASVPDLRRVEALRCGHLIHLENPHWCAKTIGEFLS